MKSHLYPAPVFRLPTARALALAGLLTAGLCGPAGPSRATTYTWTGNDTASGNYGWNDSANWSGGQAAVSAADTDLIFGSLGTSASNAISYQNVANPFSLNSLFFSSGAPSYVLSGGTFTVGSGGFYTSSVSTETINNAVSLASDQSWGWNTGAGLMAFGGGVANDGHTLYLNASGTSSNALSAAITGTGSLIKLGAGALTLSGASTYTGATTVSAGTLAVGSGGSVTGGNLNVGAGATLAISGTGSVSPGGNGTLTVDGTSASAASVTLADTGNLSTSTAYIGYNGGGAFMQSGGNFTTNGKVLYLGYNSGGTGTYSLQAGSLNTFGVIVGNSGAGAFTQSGGSVTIANDEALILGSNSGSSGSYSLQAGGLITGEVLVGGRGAGRFTQSGGSFTTDGQPLSLGYNIGSSGSYNLQAGSLSTGTVFVGSSGDGTFTQSGGSFSTNGDLLRLGEGSGTSGTYTLGGGTLSTMGVVRFQGTGTFNFNGGILQANASATSFFGGLTKANVQTGGAIIDTQGYGVTVSQNLLHDTTSGAPASDGGLTKLGAGTLTLSGTNTYTGTTTVNAGTLLLGSSGALGTAPTVQLANTTGATLNFNGYNLSLTSLGGGGVAGGNVSLGSGTLTINGDGTNTTFAGIVSGSGGLVKSGTGTLGLTGANTYTGNTALQGGVLAVGGNSPLGTGGTLSFQGGSLLATADTLVTNNIATTTGGTVIMAAAPGTTLTYHGNNGSFSSSQGTSFQFGTAGQTGTINFTLDSFNFDGLPYGTNPQVYVNAGTLQTSVDSQPAGAYSLAFADVHLAAGTTFDLDNQAPQIINLFGVGTVTTSVAGSGNVLSVSGGDFAGSLAGAVSLAVVSRFNSGRSTTGTLVLEGANTFTGTATVNAGHLQLSNDEALQNATAVLNTNGGLYFGSGLGTFRFGGLSGGGNQALVDTGGEAVYLQVGSNGASTSYSGALSGSGGLNKVGTGTLLLSGTNTYTGGTTVSAGTLTAANPGAFAGYNTAGHVSVNSGGTLAVRYGGTGEWQSADLSVLLGDTTFNAGSTLGVDTSDAPSAVVYDGSINGSLGLAKLGAGTLVLVDSNTYTGGTTVSAGTLQIGNGSAGTLGQGAVSDNTLLSFDRTGSLTVANSISGTGGVATIGSGTVTFTGNSTYTGGTTVNAGRLVELNTGNALGAGTVTIGGGTVLELSNSATDGTVMRQAGGTTFTGTGTLQKTGAGTVFFGGSSGNVNVALGAGGLIDVQAGTLVGSSYSQGFFTNNQAGLNIATGATFNGVEGAVLVDALTGAGTLLGGYLATGSQVGSTTIGVAGGSGVFSGTIGDNGGQGGVLSLTKTGAGIQALSGNNTYTGGTTFAGGVLNAGSAGALGSAGTLSFTGGTLQYSAANQTDYSSRFSTAANQAFSIDTNGQSIALATGLTSNGGSLIKLGAGALTLSGASTYTGATTVSAGTLAVGSGGSVTGGNLNVGAGATLAISGTGSVSPGGNGTLTVDGTSASAASVTLADTGNLSTSFAYIGYNGSGTFTQSGGSFTTNGGALVLGCRSGSSGCYSLQAGRLNAATTFIGDYGVGTFTQSGGSFSTNGRPFYIGYVGDSSGSYSLQAGSLSTVEATVGNRSAGTFTQSGGSFTTNNNLLYLAYYGGSSGTYTLGGGMLSTAGVSGGAGTSTFNFNGGTLQASASTTSFFSSLTTANVQAGGAKIDTQGYNVTVFQSLLHDTTSGVPASDGGLTKLGSGTLTLTGSNTYAGATTVSAGTLAVNGSLSGPGSLTVRSGAALAGGGTVAGTVAVQEGGTFSPGQFGAGRLTLQSSLILAGAATASFTLATTDSTQALVAGQINLGITATLSLTLASGYTPAVGTRFFLLDDTGGSLVQGHFANAPLSGSLLTVGGTTFLINYLDSDPNDPGHTLGNDLSALVVAVPEPSTWALLGLGGAGLLGLVLSQRRCPRQA